jgi:hypothetical protein
MTFFFSSSCFWADGRWPQITKCHKNVDCNSPRVPTMDCLALPYLMQGRLLEVTRMWLIKPHALRKCNSLSFICFLSRPRTTGTEKAHEFVFYLFSEQTTDHLHWQSVWVCLLSIFEGDHGPHALRKRMRFGFFRFFYADHGPLALRKCTSLYFICFLSRPRTTCDWKMHKFVFHLFSEQTTDHMHWESA